METRLNGGHRHPPPPAKNRAPLLVAEPRFNTRRNEEKRGGSDYNWVRRRGVTGFLAEEPGSE